MGLQFSKLIQGQQANRSKQISYYGGQLIRNQQTNTIYQQFFIDRQYYDHFLALIKSRQKLQHPNFITVKNYWLKNEKKHEFFCTHDMKVELFVQYQSLNQSLQSKLDQLSRVQRTIPEKQLLRIFLSVLSCLIYLKSKGTCHGDIKPESIYFDSIGNVKMLDSYFMNGGRTSYQIVMQNPSSMSLLSGEQLQRIRNKQFDDDSLRYKNEMFSLGLTMFEAMTFQPVMQCYDLQKLIIKKQFFDQKEQLMYKNNYSPELIEAVISVILLPASNRPDFQQFYTLLNQFLL